MRVKILCMTASHRTNLKPAQGWFDRAKQITTGTILLAGGLGASAHVASNFGDESAKTREVIKSLHYADVESFDKPTIEDDQCFPHLEQKIPDGEISITTGIEEINKLKDSKDETIQVNNFGTDLELAGSLTDPTQLVITGTILDSENPQITERSAFGDTFAGWLNGGDKTKFIPRKITSIKNMQGKNLELKGSAGEQIARVRKNLPENIKTISIDLTDGGADTVIIEDASHPALINIDGAQQVIIYNSNKLAGRIQVKAGASPVVVRKVPYENLQAFKTALGMNAYSRELMVADRHWEPFSETVEAYAEKAF